jgi:hypothetical protein
LKKPNNSGIDAKEALESFRKALKANNAAY